MRIHGGRPPRGVVDLSAPMNPLPRPRVFHELILECVNRGVYAGYHDPDMNEVKKAIQRLAGIGDMDVVVLNGSAEILALAPLAYRPRVVVVLEPGFGDHTLQSRAWEARLVRVLVEPRGRALHVDEESVKRAVAGGRPLIIASNPNNPLGQPLAPETLRLLEDLAEDYKGALIVDEAFQPLSSLEPYEPKTENAYRLWTPTKALALPGLRLGALAGAGSLVELLEAARQPWPLDSVAYCFYTRLVGEYIDEALDYIRRGRRAVAEWARIQAGLLAGVPGITVLETVTAFMLLEHPKLCHPRLNSLLAGHGFYVRDASSFHGLSCMHSRINVTSPGTARRLAEALREVAREWGYGIS